MNGIKTDIFFARHGDDVRSSASGSLDKPCLNEDGGIYYIEGGITKGKLQYRQSNGTNVAPLIGYKVTKGHINEEGEWMPVETMCVTKEEGLELALAYNYRNAYVASSVKKRVGGNEVSHFLKPHPTVEQSFTRDDAIVQLYEVDEFGVKVRPYELTLREDECSSELWALIEEDMNRKTSGHRENIGRKQAIKERKVEQIKQDLKLGRHNIVNPYRNKVRESKDGISTGG